MRGLMRGTLLVVGLVLASPTLMFACSLCSLDLQQKPTLREEAGHPFARLIFAGHVVESQTKPDGTGFTKLRVAKVLRNDPVLGQAKEITIPRTILPGDPKEPPRYLLYCDIFKDRVDPYRGVPDRGGVVTDYVALSTQLDQKDAVKRLKFFFDYLEHADKEIATDAFIEFAKAEDRHIGEAARTFNPERIRGWVQNKNTPQDRVGVYAFLLGVCGTDTDASLLQTMLADTSERARVAYDGVLSGLLHRKPHEAWETVLHGLGDGRTPLPLRLAMVRAVRVLYAWQPEANKANMLKAARTILTHGELADMAMEDLRRWKVWDLTPDILALYGKKGYTAPIVERSIVRYALTHKSDPLAQEFVAARRKDKRDLVEEVEEGLKFEK